jgi:hypothetical protein
MCRRERNVESKVGPLRLYDHHVRLRHKIHLIADAFFVHMHLMETGRTTKLFTPVARPYHFYEINGLNVVIRTC